MLGSRFRDSPDARVRVVADARRIAVSTKGEAMLKYSMTVACALLAIVPAVASAQTPPPALGGERLSENDPSVTTCAAGEGVGSFSYEASGTATGAYPGTFTETG